MSKTLMPYPRLSYDFSFLLQLNTHFIARYLILALCVNNRWNGQFLGPFWEQREEEQEASRNVATSQRHDVGSTRRGSQQVGNVTTPQRHDVLTSRRCNIATSARILFQHH